MIGNVMLALNKKSMLFFFPEEARDDGVQEPHVPKPLQRRIDQARMLSRG